MVSYVPLYFINDDITTIHCDAIVNAANTTLLGGGGVDGAIHRAAGPGLLRECKELGGCDTGEAKITGGYDLPCKYVIHTVGPVWYGGDRDEENLLRNCYRNSLILAASYGCESVSFPLISSGAYGYPKDQALKIAVEEISAFILDHDSDIIVNIVFLNRFAINIGRELQADLSEYIDVNFFDPRRYLLKKQTVLMAQGSKCDDVRRPGKKERRKSRRIHKEECENICEEPEPSAMHRIQFEAGSLALADSADMALCAPNSLVDELGQIDESFSEMLLRKIDERGMTDAQCYKKANIDRKLFSKIRSDRSYRPSKNTVIAFAIALELSLAETKDMLMKAGFALSRSSKFDIIIEYFIKRGNYNIFEINEALFAFDQSLLGV